MRPLLLGLGNPLLCDDAVGLEAAVEVHRLLGARCLELRLESAGGLELLELLAGRPAAVIIDSLLAEGVPAGTLLRLDLERSRASLRTGGTHALGLLEGLELGRRLGWAMPDPLRVYAVAVEDPFTFGEGLSPAVAAALPGLAARIAREVGPVGESGREQEPEAPREPAPGPAPTGLTWARRPPAGGAARAGSGCRPWCARGPRRRRRGS